MVRVLVLCTGNSCRSQMAEGYLRHFAQGKAQVFSAGVEAHGVNARAIAVMKEDGIDISTHTSKTVDAFQGEPFDFVITVCDNARESCPYFPSGAKKLHHNFPDPARTVGTEEQITAQFHHVRHMIKIYCQDLIHEEILR